MELGVKESIAAKPAEIGYLELKNTQCFLRSSDSATGAEAIAVAYAGAAIAVQGARTGDAAFYFAARTVVAIHCATSGWAFGGALRLITGERTSTIGTFIVARAFRHACEDAGTHPADPRAIAGTTSGRAATIGATVEGALLLGAGTHRGTVDGLPFTADELTAGRIARDGRRRVVAARNE